MFRPLMYYFASEINNTGGPNYRKKWKITIQNYSITIQITIYFGLELNQSLLIKKNVKNTKVENELKMYMISR